ncbi:MAG: PGF-pre-PGF domain-containing protein [Candidatus Aenigmarchaeota archaeon]|nr:PGF-pre-PGF domain-containing protein [Candidatus Aenigmarchaeota archaeon]
MISSIVIAANCWQYTAQSTCSADTGCKWKSDGWGSWCEELNCWSISNQTGCTANAVPAKNCTWQGGSTIYGCEKMSCWSFSGTSETQCQNNTANLSCTWYGSCYNTGGAAVDCWNRNTQSTCLNTTGCSWGSCQDKGCWNYNTNTTCLAAKDWRGNNCTWDSGYCQERGCWKNYNESSCNAAVGINCQWKWGSCQELDCWNWDFTNQSSCENNTRGLSCTWNNNYCSKKDCWQYTTNSTCSAKPSCTWRAYTSNGWCEEVQCWSWDSWRSGNRTTCENNSYGLSCAWSGNPSGNLTNGWCGKNTTAASCSNLTTEKACMDTYYCWWQFTDWNNPTLGGTCNTPGSFGGATTNTSFFSEWNPGCYIFDMNATACNKILGCNYSTANSTCDALNNSYGQNITSVGINCFNVNDSQTCNSIPALSTCCQWNNGTCSDNKMSTSCISQMQTSPEGASFCEDYNSFTDKSLCEQIAGSPWYMPCQWDNATERCGFKADSVFGNETQSLVKIDNKKNCEAAGGKWIIENYCEGNASVPVGRCENKFDEESSCDKACFACESKDSSGGSVNSTNARDACVGSKLGYCEFVNDTSASNRIGLCKAKDQFKKGVASNCDSECGDCTYKGDSINNDPTKKPSYYCVNSKANSANGGCKWISDNATSSGGYCVKKGEKTCEDACDRCNSQTDCTNKGRITVVNKTGSCKWQGSSIDGSCVANVAGDVEICWDGTDNTNDGLVDCADPSCYADSYCGFVSGDCFGWTTNNICVSNGCEWVNDTWNPAGWCDFKGGQCWKFDTGQTACETNNNCKWTNGTGSSWCEQNWTKAETCMGVSTRNACNVLSGSGCNWTADTWCNGTGSGTTWCQNTGGWCDHTSFKKADCWIYTGSSDCGNTSGCSWKSDSYALPHCEANYTANCWQYITNTTCNAVSKCVWDTSAGGPGWCMNRVDKCSSWDSPTQASCETKTDGSGNRICYWENWGGFCQSLCFNQSSNSQAGCNANPLCAWKEQSGWCEQSSGCSSKNTTACNIDSSCKWKNSGYCDPKGGGFSAGSATAVGGKGSAIGGDCYKYDGNQTLCTNRSAINLSCGWFPEPSPRCDVDWSRDCWQYTSEAAGCNSGNGCWWNAQTNMCSNLMDQCWMNQTLQQNSAACNATSVCRSSQFGCEPVCFSNTSASSCSAQAGCRWMTGYCNPADMTQMFTGMESGAPVPLGMDICDNSETNQSSVDICGFGMKDMVDSYGFGINVKDFSNSSVCNKEKLSSFVMGMAGSGGMGSVGIGGGGFGFGQERQGSGNETVIVLIYLDTDGSTSGGCSLSHNSSATGYEFRFKYTSEWNSTLQKAIETFNAYKCDNSDWKATDIKLSAWKKKMCSEIGGPMIAVAKADLSKYPTLYNSTKDIRIAVATIGNTGNISSPTDRAGPGWTTPGAIDFSIDDMFKYGAYNAKFEDVLKKGFIQNEDCFNGIDDNADGVADCNDYDCQYAKVCEGLGVNAAGYNDTRAPQVSGVKIEEYPDSALILYDTNKPTNGTLQFYGNDSQCMSQNATINDIGIISASVRDFKSWHSASILNGTNSLNYPLANSTIYYYKLKVCDSGGKCAISKCSNFKTPASMAKCSYCNFVTRIKTPGDWNVYYDLNQDGTYDHWQGHVCGPNSGMKTNYTDGRRANIKLVMSNGTGAIEFINVTLTKTGLNDKVRTISNSTALIYNGSASDSSGNTIGYVGMISETRDKIVNNLYPELCRITIPRGTTSCNRLYHCNDNATSCIDRTNESILVSSNTTACTWQLPYCEFSTWGSGEPGAYTVPATTTSSGSGGGGGGGSSTTKKSISYGSISAGSSVTISDFNIALALQTVQVKVKTGVSAITFTLDKMGTKPAVATDYSADVYKYLNITKSFDDSAISEVVIGFSVDKNWTITNGVEESKIALYRWTTKWDKLDTVKTGSNASHIVYKATSPGLSYFMIAEVKEEAAPVETPTQTPAETPAAPVALCNNGIIDSAEECDGFELGENTCQTLGFYDGALKCSSCKYDTTYCEKKAPFLLEPEGTQTPYDYVIIILVLAVVIAGGFFYYRGIGKKK